MFFKHPAAHSARVFVKQTCSLRRALMDDIKFYSQVLETTSHLQTLEVRDVIIKHLVAIDKIRAFFNTRIKPAANRARWMTRRKFWLTSRDHELAELFQYASIDLLYLKEALNFYFDDTMTLVKTVSEEVNAERVGI